MSITLETTAGISLLTIGSDENRFSPQWLDEIERALDEAVALQAPLVTLAEGKFFSNGLDLDWVNANPDEFDSYLNRVEKVLARFLALPVPTVAAINGHAFGAGAMLALAHDWRLMRADRGYFCLPEVDINIPFTPGMASLIQAKLSPQAAIDSMTTGTRFGGHDAAKLGLVGAAVDQDRLTEDAVRTLEPLRSKSVGTLERIKETMFAPTLRLLRGAGPTT